jgi:hypothetical protein
MIVFTFIFYRWSQREDRDIPAVPGAAMPELRVVRARS